MAHAWLKGSGTWATSRWARAVRRAGSGGRRRSSARSSGDGTGAGEIGVVGAGSDTAVYSESRAAISVDLATGAGNGGNAQGDRLVSIENVSGSLYDDVIGGDGNANKLSGWDGAKASNRAAVAHRIIILYQCCRGCGRSTVGATRP